MVGTKTCAIEVSCRCSFVLSTDGVLLLSGRSLPTAVVLFKGHALCFELNAIDVACQNAAELATMKNHESVRERETAVDLSGKRLCVLKPVATCTGMPCALCV